MRVTQLHWGVKESFRRYVEAAGGEIEVLDGAERTAEGVFAFPATPDSDLRLGADRRPEGVGRLQGSVRFAAHGGMLSVRLSTLSLEVDGEGASLKVADDRGNPVEIARLDLASATDDDGDLVIPARLSMDGSYLLGDHYPPRTVIDPVRLKLAG